MNSLSLTLRDLAYSFKNAKEAMQNFDHYWTINEFVSRKPWWFQRKLWSAVKFMQSRLADTVSQLASHADDATTIRQLNRELEIARDDAARAPLLERRVTDLQAEKDDLRHLNQNLVGEKAAYFAENRRLYKEAMQYKSDAALYQESRGALTHVRSELAIAHSEAEKWEAIAVQLRTKLENVRAAMNAPTTVRPGE
jgi:hypothetical protein